MSRHKIFAFGNFLKLTFIFWACISVPIQPANSEYIFPYRSPSNSNYGGAGLIKMPSARFHDAGTIGLRWSSFDPYLRGSILAYPFSWMEASYQYTDINNALYSDFFAFSGDQTYKDKGFDFKIRILKERNLLPNVALGIRDAAGTGVFSAEYLVASKFIGNFDLTFGLGWGNLSNNETFRNPLGRFKNSMYLRGSELSTDTQGGEFSLKRYFTGDVGIFGGIEYFIPNARGLRLKLEYDGTDYLEEGFPTPESFPFAFDSVKQPDSKINYGVVYPVNNLLTFDLAYSKGNTINFGFTVALPLGPKDPIVSKKDPYVKVRNISKVRAQANESDISFYRAILQNMNSRDIYLQAANKNESTIEILFSQNKFSSWAMASGRAARVLDDVSPELIKKFKISNINAGMGTYTVNIDRDAFHQNKENNYYKLLRKSSSIESYTHNMDEYAYQPKVKFPIVFWQLEPALRTQIGGPDEFFLGDVRLQLKTETLITRNFSLVTGATIGLYDNFDRLKNNASSLLPQVRTNIVPYLKESRKVAVERLQFNYFLNPYKNIYSKFSAGIFEEMFGGVGGEIIYKPFTSNYGIGAELWRVKQRNFDMRFSFLDYQTTTGHINLYYHEQKSNILLELKGGKFLAGDSGIRFDFSRLFKSNLRIGAFFALTDISKEEFGEGSFDKGFYFHLPLNVFSEKYEKRKIPWGLRPLTRDGAAKLNHSHFLWGVIEQASYNTINNNWDDIYD